MSVLSLLIYVSIFALSCFILLSCNMKGESSTMLSKLKSKNGVIIIVIIFLIFILFTRRDHSQNFYGIIFDAGSTGSRIHVFKFVKSGGKDWNFQDELFEHVQPGLSSYSEDPQKAAKSLEGMLNKAKEYIPKEYWPKTSLSLYATAGLRLLPDKKSTEILTEVRKLFRTTPFLFEDKSVKIMASSDEGIFSWLTVNFLKKTLRSDQTIGAIDLGGGSIQITFVPEDKDTLHGAAQGTVHKISTLGFEITAFSKSYLGRGLMSARLQMLGGKQSDSKTSLSSVCLPDDYSGTWIFQNRNYTITGENAGSSRFESCQRIVTEKVLGDIDVNIDFSGAKFLLLSYFYDRGKEVELFNSLEAKVQPRNYLDAAKRVCNDKASQKQKRFRCFDLIYLGTILQQGFKFGVSHDFDIAKKISGTEISWALGAMLSQLP